MARPLDGNPTTVRLPPQSPSSLSEQENAQQARSLSPRQYVNKGSSDSASYVHRRHPAREEEILNKLSTYRAARSMFFLQFLCTLSTLSEVVVLASEHLHSYCGWFLFANVVFLCSHLESHHGRNYIISKEPLSFCDNPSLGVPSCESHYYLTANLCR